MEQMTLAQPRPTYSHNVGSQDTHDLLVFVSMQTALFPSPLLVSRLEYPRRGFPTSRFDVPIRRRSLSAIYYCECGKMGGAEGF